jgi:hypothetical protein
LGSPHEILSLIAGSLFQLITADKMLSVRTVPLLVTAAAAAAAAVLIMRRGLVHDSNWPTMSPSSVSHEEDKLSDEERFTSQLLHHQRDMAALHTMVAPVVLSSFFKLFDVYEEKSGHIVLDIHLHRC